MALDNGIQKDKFQMTLNYSSFPKYNTANHNLILGRGDNLQLFISPLLKYEEWLYNIMDDENLEINSLEPTLYMGSKVSTYPNRDL